MFDCAKDVLSYHDDEVTLPRAEQKNMRDRRDANRKRLEDGLKEADRPAPLNFDTQGSYAMRTMVQLPDKDWDIDDGVYFDAANLKGERGGEMSALEARQMVRDALDDGTFEKQPEVRTNCVRVYYEAGYRVDIPVYRVRIEKSASGEETAIVELASADWKRSDARDVTEWFNEENEKQSPDTDNGRQLRRITRDLKKYARSRASWADKILSGFGITKLVTECFRGSAVREDEALVNTMRAIRDRLDHDLVIKHPMTPNETITKESDDASARFLRDKIKEGLESLKILDDPSCTRTQALAAWDKFYATDYFSKRGDSQARMSEAAASILPPSLLRSRSETTPPPVRKDGGGRYA
jgi:hypothetical protein